MKVSYSSSQQLALSNNEIIMKIWKPAYSRISKEVTPSNLSTHVTCYPQDNQNQKMKDDSSLSKPEEKVYI